MRGFVPLHPVELFPLLLSLSGKSFPHRAQGEHICRAHLAPARDNEIWRVSSLREEGFPSLSKLGYYLIQFALCFEADV